MNLNKKRNTYFMCMVCLMIAFFLLSMQQMEIISMAASGITAGGEIPSLARGVTQTPAGQTVKPTADEKEKEAPFTPDGSATVVDNATEEQGKEFYTIVTPDENVFFLVIDKQRDSDNVYFLNAVTERDLIALAQKEEAVQTLTPAEPEEPEPPKIEEPENLPPVEKEPEPERNNGMMLIVFVIVLAVGGTGYYFKIYKAKHELDDAEDIDDFEFEGPEDVTIHEEEEGEAEQSRSYEEDNEDILIEEGSEDDLIF